MATKDKDSAFKDKIKKKILDRSWYQVSDAWLSALPNVGSTLDPDFALLEAFEPVRQTVLDLAPDIDDHVCEVAGVREILFQESLFLFHKAINVLSIAERGTLQGRPTWSLSTSYHAAFFGIRSLTRLLGVGHFPLQGKIWIVDIFPQREKISRWGKGPVFTEPEMRLFRSPAQFEQRHVWQMFQRLATITKFEDSVARRLASDLWKMDSGSFSLQRHNLLYQNNSWYFGDLYRVDQKANFGIRSSEFSIKEELGEDDFTLLLAYSIVELVRRLLASLRTKTNILNDLLDMIENSIDEERHPIYGASREICFA